MKKHPTYPGRKKSPQRASLIVPVLLLVLVAASLGAVIILEKSGYAQSSSSPEAVSSQNASDSSRQESSLSSGEAASSQETSSEEASLGPVSSENPSSEQTASSSSQTASLSPVSSEAPVSSETSSQTGAVNETGDWRLIVVNRNNLLPEDFSVNLAVASNPRLMDSRVVQAAQDFMAAAADAGYPLQMISGYRSVEMQTTLFNNKVNEYLSAGYSQTDAETEAAKWVAVPRTSEHHTGLACDLITVDYYNYFSDLVEDFDTTDACKWMMAHCAEYGFVVRYPEGKTDITGITYEPWHYRYVGVDNAQYMTEHNLCLEEYVAYLTGQPVDAVGQ